MNFNEKYGEYGLITGGSSGIGKAIAFELAAKGLHLILVARRKEELLQAQAEITKIFQVKVVLIQADLGSPQGLETIKNEAKNYKVGLFVPAAGMEVNGSFEKNALEKELMSIQLNVVSVMQLSHHFVQKMVERKTGGLLFVASLSGHMPNPYFANYAGTKAYILNFGASLYGELKPKGIDVSVLSPGLTKTPMTTGNGVDWSKTPMSAMTPQEVAKTAINALGKRFMVIPGAKNKIMAAMAKHSSLQMQANMNEKMMRKAIIASKL